MTTARPPERLSEAARARIAASLAARAGLEVPEWVLDARVRERIAALEAAGALDPGAGDAGDAYADLVAAPGGAAELDRLIEGVRVGETRFFRHRAHVRALVNEVVPALRERIRPGQPVRAWSAGCATGEEAYTLAMILGRLLPGREVRVLATDLSQSALAHARQGVYPAAALATVPERWRRYGFEDEPEPRPGARTEQWRVVPEVRRRVTFRHHNLLDPDYPDGMDLIWCRNVLIYLAPEARQQVAHRLARSLGREGYLFVGYAESLRDAAGLEPVRTVEAVLYRKAEARPPEVRAPARPEGRPALPAAAPMPARSGRDAGATGAAAAAGAPATAAPAAGAPATTRVCLSGRYEDEHRLATELRAVMARGHARVVIDLDGAAFLADTAAPVLRRAQSAARAAGATVHLHADRPGIRRWLRRHGLVDDDSPGLPARGPGSPPGALTGDGLGNEP